MDFEKLLEEAAGKKLAGKKKQLQSSYDQSLADLAELEQGAAQQAREAATRRTAEAKQDRAAWNEIQTAQGLTSGAQSQALLEILQKAAELFPQDMGRQSAPPKEEPADRNEDAVNPFPEAFPFSRWKRISYPGTDRYYLEGEARMQGATYRIHALPGEYRPGRRPKGFDRFLRARDGSGYWVRVRREQ